MSNLLAKDVRDKAYGNWLTVLDRLAPEIRNAIEKPGIHIGCPVHTGRDGFRLFRDANVSGGGVCNTCGPKPDGFALLMWLKDWTFPEALSAVADIFMIPSNTTVTKPKVNVTVKPKSMPDDRRIISVLRKTWMESKSIHHSAAEPVRLYLQSRGLDTMIPDWPSIRFHPRMPYRNEDGKLIGYYPAILALVERGNEAITIHRTFLTPDGRKAPVRYPKKMMSVPSNKIVMGSAIRLGVPGRVLSVTEGLETALAVIEATGMVTWALISSSFMSGFIIPDGVEKLIIWSDLDREYFLKGEWVRPGSEAAAKLAERAVAQGIEVEVREPKCPIPVGAKSVDWLDVLNHQGPNAFGIRSCDY